jgi:hypothetical protein
MVPITFDENDFQVRDFPCTDAFVATANVARFIVHNILKDNGSSIDILFIKPFQQMNLDRRTLKPVGNSLFGLSGKKIDALGKKAIPVYFAEGEKICTETITFDIVNMDYPYTAISGKGVLNKFEMVIKQSYLCMKMSSPFGVITVHGDQAASRQIEGKPIPGYSLVNQVAKKPPSEEADGKEAVEPRAQATEDTLKTPLFAIIP